MMLQLDHDAGLLPAATLLLPLLPTYLNTELVTKTTINVIALWNRHKNVGFCFPTVFFICQETAIFYNHPFILTIVWWPQQKRLHPTADPWQLLKTTAAWKREVSNIQPHAKKIIYKLYWDADYLKIVPELLLPVRFTKWLLIFIL